MMLLPLHPQPHSGEILSSWMVRLAFANGFPLHTFYANLLGYRAPIWNRDTDRHPSPALLEVLGRCTGQPLLTLRALTLSAYDGILFEQLPMIGNASWILPVGVLHRTRRRAGMQFCPLCLRCDADPYYRRSWRLAIHARCEHHQCVMEQYCPSCCEPVAYHRHGIGRGRVISDQALRFCHRCGFDLGRKQPIYLDWPDVVSSRSFDEMMHHFERGAWKCGYLTPPCAVPFFAGLRALVSVIIGRYGQRLRSQLSNTLGLSLDTCYVGRRVEFEYLGALERLKLLLAVSWLLEDWPSRFIAMCGACRFTRSRLAEEVRTLPFWLASVADEYLDNRPYLHNADEIYAACSYLLAQQRSVTRGALGHVLGLSKDSANTALRIWHERTEEAGK
ncbi:MAG: TniQ family protein [Cupriavidus sp.]|nr:TniQ family protein [Cupriavidus sp.]